MNIAFSLLCKVEKLEILKIIFNSSKKVYGSATVMMPNPKNKNMLKTECPPVQIQAYE